MPLVARKVEGCCGRVDHYFRGEGHRLSQHERTLLQTIYIAAGLRMEEEDHLLLVLKSQEDPAPAE